MPIQLFLSDAGEFAGAITGIMKAWIKLNNYKVDASLMTEAISDPWLERKQGFEWRGNPYASEMVSDLMLQLIDMGLVMKP